MDRKSHRPPAESEGAMTRHTRKRWIDVCLFGAALGAAGCSTNVQRPGVDCCAGLPITSPAPPAAAPVASPGAPAVPGAGGRPTQLPPMTIAGTPGAPTIPPVPAAAVTAAAGSRFQTTTVTALSTTAPQPTLVADARPATPRKKRPRSHPVLTLDTGAGENRYAVTPAAGAAPAGAIRQVSYQGPRPEAPSHTPDGAPRRAYVDLTAQPWFGHGDDHSWLSGQVLYSHSTKTWRLHYASVDDNDPYGGTVTLVGDDTLHQLKDGQYVRVCGSPIDPDRRAADAPYRVTSFEAVAHAQ
jgi:hypothetical protein